MTTMETAEQRYMFDAAWQVERRRLAALETIWDPFTFSNLEALPVEPGARCLEVGGGNGSVASWLCERSGILVPRLPSAIGAPARLSSMA